MVTATDPDIVDHSRLVYGITGGNAQQMFDINSKSGTNKIIINMNTEVVIFLYNKYQIAILSILI